MELSKFYINNYLFVHDKINEGDELKNVIVTMLMGHNVKFPIQYGQTDIHAGEGIFAHTCKVIYEYNDKYESVIVHIYSESQNGATEIRTLLSSFVEKQICLSIS